MSCSSMNEPSCDRFNEPALATMTQLPLVTSPNRQYAHIGPHHSAHGTSDRFKWPAVPNLIVIAVGERFLQTLAQLSNDFGPKQHRPIDAVRGDRFAAPVPIEVEQKLIVKSSKNV
uniref:Uncharacterized protein n=1 Tax=Anopheles melas TaxID=34690 RepID=A0A182U491_9DIPT